MEYKLKAELFTLIGKKKHYYNLNIYRNANYHVLNKAKIQYKEMMLPQILLLPKFDRIKLIYTLYPKTKRKTDISNVLSIHDKMMCDAMVERGIISDDDYTVISEVVYKFGCIDKKNPRVEVEIEVLL